MSSLSVCDDLTDAWDDDVFASSTAVRSKAFLSSDDDGRPFTTIFFRGRVRIDYCR